MDWLLSLTVQCLACNNERLSLSSTHVVFSLLFGITLIKTAVQPFIHLMRQNYQESLLSFIIYFADERKILFLFALASVLGYEHFGTIPSRDPSLSSLCGHFQSLKWRSQKAKVCKPKVSGKKSPNVDASVSVTSYSLLVC